MRYISYITDYCKDQAEAHNYQDRLDQQAQKIEADQSVSNWDNFLPRPVIRKKIGRKFRLIANQRYIEAIDVNFVSFIEFLPRGHSDYEKFIDDAEEFCQPLIPTDDELIKYYQKYHKQKKIPALEKPSEIEYWYLHDNTLDKSEDQDYVPVLESKSWVQRIMQPEYQNYLTRFYDLLDTEISNQASRPSALGYDIAECKTSGVQILYFVAYGQLIYLAAPFLPNESSEEKQAIMKIYLDDRLDDDNNVIPGQFEAWMRNLDVGEIARHSRRKYPELIRASEELWKSIQRNETGNLALSTEEYAILESVSQEGSYPLFINGRPGSGKSTILMYLFSEHLYKHLRRLIDPDETPLSNPPIYLTYSRRLLKVAQDSVAVIMKSNHTFALYNSIDFDDEFVQAEISRSFATFHEFLLALLDEEKRQGFLPANRCEYAQFSLMWNKFRLKNPDAQIRRTSAELAWHVIRTYIKGMRDETQGDDSFLDPDAYKELSIRQKSVPDEMYQFIYDKVWLNWYKPLAETHHLWDSQDLVHTVLDSDVDLSHYPAIFCDEAQDFTQVELELLLRLSIYSRRVLNSREIQHVPFAFAGDPFQTLNPTGFDWNHVQTGFYEKIIKGLDRYGNESFDINYRELDFNYRTTQNVVGICNLIQLWRGIIFGIQDLHPQLLWFDDRAAPMNVYFSTTDPVIQRALDDQTEIVIILPCQEGEEEEFVKNDEFLQTLLAEDNEPRNFFSAMSAKGLEFSRVVLYKFGEQYIENYSNLFDPIVKRTQPHEDPEELLSLQYFLNRLYVAASRPTKRLFILDTNEGLQEFWLQKEIQNYEHLIERYNPEKWEVEHLAYITQGTENSLRDFRDNPLELAEILEAAGLAEQSPYKLKLAAANFLRANQPHAALRCDAERAEIEMDWETAGNLYLELGNKNRSLDIFWQYSMFDKILRPEFEGQLEHRIADFMHASRTIADCLNMVEFLLDDVMRTLSKRNRIEIHSQRIMDAVLQRLSEDPKVKLNWDELYQAIGEIHYAFKLPDTVFLGYIAFMAERYDVAVDIWDNTFSKTINIPDHIRQFRQEARLQTTPFPKKLELLDSIGLKDQILEWWQAHYKRPSLLEQREHQEIVWKILLANNEHFLIEKFISERKLRTAIRLFEAMQHYSKLNDPDSAMRFGKGFINTASRNIKFTDNQINLTKLFKQRIQILNGKKPENHHWSIDAHLVTALSEVEDDWQSELNDRRAGYRVKDLQNAVDDYFITLREQSYFYKFDVQILGLATERVTTNKTIAIDYYNHIARDESEDITQTERKLAQERWRELVRDEINRLESSNRKVDARKLRKELEVALEEFKQANSDDSASEDQATTPDNNWTQVQVKGFKALYNTGMDAEQIAGVMQLPVKMIEQAIEAINEDSDIPLDD